MKAVPAGFKYQPEVLSPEHEQSIVERVRSLPFKEFEFQGFVGKRRTVSFGWRYDFNDRSLQKADDIPDFLLSLRETAGEFAELPSSALQQVLVTEYEAGAAIGWHRDKKVFGDVVGISLLSACRFRFRRKSGSSWERAAIIVEPRSAYLLRGPSRTEWEHSIPGVETLRYSITYRSLLESA
jgi:alkylated DNA repair dioxygenase AlkB